MRRTTLPPHNLVGGIARLASFNASGFAAVGNTSQAFLTSLAPLIAFLVVGTALKLLSGHWRLALADGLQTLCILLGQPVLSHALARHWQREPAWLRYAAAMNWCQLAIPVVAALFTMAIFLFGGASLPPRVLVWALVGAVFAYAAALNWFLAWRGLDLSAPRAVLFVLMVTAALALVLALPVALRQATMPGTAAGGVVT